MTSTGPRPLAKFWEAACKYRPGLPTAVSAGTDTAALGVLRAAQELGLRVPEDLSFAGADNIPVSAIPQISVDANGFAVGGSLSRACSVR
ncbi:substrate-binding domain-containing protein [Streptomyces sp. NPDC002596]